MGKYELSSGLVNSILCGSVFGIAYKYYLLKNKVLTLIKYGRANGLGIGGNGLAKDSVDFL